LASIEWQIGGRYRDVHNGGVRRDGFSGNRRAFLAIALAASGSGGRTFGDPAGMAKSITAMVRWWMRIFP